MMTDPSGAESTPPAPAPGQLFRQAWIFYLLLSIAGILWIGVQTGGPLTLEPFFDLKWFWLDGLVGFGAAFLLILTWRLGCRFSRTMEELEVQLASMIGPLERSEALGLALLSGFAEELFFRGAMLSSWGLIPTTLLFGLIHIGPGKSFRPWTLFALLAGLLFAGLTLWRGNLLAAWVAHMVVNGVNLRRLTRVPETPEVP